jgi:transcriptional regulator with XRE-family HTH domain
MNEDLKHKAINLLKELGYTAYRISQDTGLSQSIIGKWLSGKVEPSEANAKYIYIIVIANPLFQVWKIKNSSRFSRKEIGNTK